MNNMKVWYVSIEGFKVKAKTYDDAWTKAYSHALYRRSITPTNVELCEEEHCDECNEL